MSHFRCQPLACTLTVSACAKRHRVVERTKAGKQPRGTPGVLCVSCLGCPVGRAHRAGETPERWADGTAVVRLTIAAPAPSVAPKKRKRFSLSPTFMTRNGPRRAGEARA